MVLPLIVNCRFIFDPEFDFRLSTLEVYRPKEVWSRGLPCGQLVAMATKPKLQLLQKIK